MLQRLHSRTRAIIVMLSMALMVVVSAQGAITLMDRTQHALGLTHAATPLAGAVHYDQGHHHDGGGLMAETEQGEADEQAPGAHQHFAEGPQLAIAPVARLAELVLARAPAIGLPKSDGELRNIPGRLERPPKTPSKTIA